MLAVNTNSNEFRFAAAAGGSTSSATALTQVALNALVGGQPLRDAIAAKRLHAVNAPDVVQLEADYPNGATLQAAGHELSEGMPPAHVNALQCTSGRPKPSNCNAASDPRGAGMAIVVGKD
jgi:gamma-glutamyltranspeptidase/glutathione hydrolase